jgi:hypothetical protein
MSDAHACGKAAYREQPSAKGSRAPAGQPSWGPYEGTARRDAAREELPIASGGEVGRRVAIGEQADVGLHSKRVAVGADEKVADCLGLVSGEEHDEESSDDPQARRDE